MTVLQSLWRYVRTTLFLTLGLAVVSPLHAEQKKGAPPSPDQKAIEAIITRIPSAVLNREVDTLVSFLTDSVEVTIYGRAAKGKENIRSLLNVGLTRFIDVKVETKTRELSFGNKRASQQGYFKYTIEWPMGGTTVRDGDFLAHWEQVGRDWLLARIVVTPPPPAETPEKK